MKKLLMIFCLILIGCTDSEENASANLRSGDEFFAKGEYEIAEYYYDKIPEESVLYKTVQRRRQEILKKNPATGIPGQKSEKAQSAETVTLVRHSHTLKMGRMPIHSITLLNNTSKKLNIVELEFIYLDDSEKEVYRSTTMINANLSSESEKEFGNIMPGMVSAKFTKVNVILKQSLFF